MTDEQATVDATIRLLILKCPRVIDSHRRLAKSVAEVLKLQDEGLTPEQAIEGMKEDLSRSTPSIDEIRCLLRIQNPGAATAKGFDEIAELLDDFWTELSSNRPATDVSLAPSM